MPPHGHDPMCRLYAFRASHPTTPSCELIDSQNSLMRQAERDERGLENADGWGIAERFLDGTLDWHRQAKPADESELYRREATDHPSIATVAQRPSGDRRPSAGCDENARCDDSSDQAECACRPGYTVDGYTCEEVVITCTDDGDCDANATCEDEQCRCNDGREGDGSSCADIDECGFDEDDCADEAT